MRQIQGVQFAQETQSVQETQRISFAEMISQAQQAQKKQPAEKVTLGAGEKLFEMLAVSETQVARVLSGWK